MKKRILFVFFFSFSFLSFSQITLTHNVCDDIIETGIHSCTSSYIYWARAFTLKDFGISTDEELIINSGQVGINKTGWLPEISFNIYKIDEGFPNSFSETDLIGSSQYQQISPNIGRTSQIIQVDFDTPIVIPANVERILVEVHKGIVYGDGLAFIAGTVQDNGVSWQRGCTLVVGGANFGNTYVSTSDFGYSDANFYINVTGNVNHTTNNFEMSISNICSEFLKEFSVENKANIASVMWDFGDPSSGVSNTSTDLSPFHDFSADGEYTITATVTGNNGSIEVLTETIDVKEPPNAYGISNLQACEASFATGFSSSFNTSTIQSQVLGSQTGGVVTYIDGSGNEYDVLPNPFTNTVKHRETITVRVARADELCCYSEITFDLIVNPLPFNGIVENIFVCDDDYDGIALFDFTQIKTDILSHDPNAEVLFFREDGTPILDENISAVENKKGDIEAFTVQARNPNTQCTVETSFEAAVEFKPFVFSLPDILGCDDDGDGISEYFDLSGVKTTVMGNQSGLDITFFDGSGNAFVPSNPYTNSTPYQEELTVRLTFPHTQCFSETPLILKTSNKPQINTPQNVYACNEGNGFSTFNLASIESEIIGNQTNLDVYYFDASGNDITSFISSNYKNSEAWEHTIFVKAENTMSNQCVSETSFKLIVNELPAIVVKNEYFLCNLEPTLPITVNSKYNAYEWKFEGTVISNSHEATLVDAGNYSLKISEIKNGISCENSYDFKLIRSVLPKIENVEFQELSDTNFIKINASGDGDFQYSLDGNIYQNSNTFNPVLGGIYTVYVRDALGCGEDSKEITIIDYPKYFTPNNDGYNDYWQIKGIENYPNASIIIYDRYGKLLKQISANGLGWDGSFGGKNMPNSDYWFTVNLNNEKSFTGHFSLKR